MRRAIVAIAVMLATAPIALAVTHHVDWSGGGDYLTIQEGMDAASHGDTVLVASGTYTGPGNRNLSVTSKSIVIMSESGLGSTIIDCESVDRAFYFRSTGQDTSLVIKGFWIRNGYTNDYNGAGIIFHGVGAIVEDCLFTDCVASHNGGALSVGYNSYPIPVKVRNCVFERNTATYRGGAALVDHGSAAFRRCLFRDNWTTGTGHYSYGGGAVNMNWIDTGERPCECHISRCTFVGNSSPGNGSAVHANESVVQASVSQCTIAFNSGVTYAFYSDPMFESLTVSNIYGNEGGDVAPGYSTLVDGDPLFCDLAYGDISLCSNSPCLPGNNTYGVLIGFADQGCPECDSAVRESSWGKIKALYR